jgi:hypothetical protein
MFEEYYFIYFYNYLFFYVDVSLINTFTRLESLYKLFFSLKFIAFDVVYEKKSPHGSLGIFNLYIFIYIYLLVSSTLSSLIFFFLFSSAFHNRARIASTQKKIPYRITFLCSFFFLLASSYQFSKKTLIALRKSRIFS